MSEHGQLSGKESKRVELDGVDYEILRELSRNARESFRGVAARLDLHPSTVIQRVEKMEKEGILFGYAAHLDYLKLGYEFMAVIQVIIAKGALLEAQEKIAKMKGVYAVYDVTGAYDAIVIAMCKNRSEFSKLVKKILSLKEVERTNTNVVLNIIKDGHEFVPE
ncbi:Lrp/AsnC family transcriptional regulator [Candidatus Micrarchaeota archaeon]|nr:Lrp/AsnC family transcriptional regulator [Candidatus Micrarchaeota archaeon]